MKRTFVFALCLAASLCGAQDQVIRASFPKPSGGGGGTWSAGQHKFPTPTEETACAAHLACTMAIPSTTAGRSAFLIGFAFKSGAPTNTQAYSSASGACASWQHNAASDNNYDYTGGGSWVSIYIAYCPSISASATSVTMTLTSSTGNVDQWSMEYVDATWSGSTVTLDSTNHTQDTTTCTSCAGQALTLTGASDFQCQAINHANAPSAITGGAFTSPVFSDFDTNYGSSGVSCAINTTNGTAPTWTTAPTGKGLVSGIAMAGS